MTPSSTLADTAPLAAPQAQAAFDGWRSISISLYMTLVGYAVLVGVPVISTAWVELLGFTEEQVGRVAGADLGGLSLGAVLASLLVSRMNRRLLIGISVAIAVACNGLCTARVAPVERGSARDYCFGIAPAARIAAATAVEPG